ncbi:hypothetical protein BRC19_01030 [Candidatus Saccharibacteria bacterium QS_5_54_17]|nr:MAG: hypothetical protein BRC19_01030 [Candidatus Saccharibacteria bacterium QS_5_54_17]
MGRKEEEGKVGDRRAKIRKEGDRIDAKYNFRPGEKGPRQHDHLVSNDGVNAAYLREDGETIVDNTEDTSTEDTSEES